MSDIPEEIVKEILFRLPVKTILKFRCVCRCWLSLIDSSYFMKTHLSYAIPKITLSFPTSLFSLQIDTIKPVPAAKVSILELCYPPKTSNLLHYLIGSCNGLILSHITEQDISLQNPSTRSFHKIPFVDINWPGPGHHCSAPERFIYGMWYDKLNDDFKVIRNVQYYDDLNKPFYSKVNVYSLNMNSWKKVDPFPYYIKYEAANDTLVGCALHWVVSTASWDPSQWIYAFDTVTEEHRLVEQPEYAKDDFEMQIYVLGGCLTVVYNYFVMECVDLWVMKEYGKVESWSKLISFHTTGMELRYLKPLVYSECGKQVLLEKDFQTFLWYDLENKTIEFVELSGQEVPERFQAFLLFESLVKLSCGALGDVKRNDEKQKKTAKNRDDFLSKGFKLKL